MDPVGPETDTHCRAAARSPGRGSHQDAVAAHAAGARTRSSHPPSSVATIGAMPIYEFRCRACRRKTTALVLSRERLHEVRCQSCGGDDLERLWSRFATVKSEDARLDALADPSAIGDLDDSDPRSMARWMKRMGREMGEDLGEDFEEALEQEAAGDGHGPAGGDGGSGPDSTDL